MGATTGKAGISCMRFFPLRLEHGIPLKHPKSYTVGDGCTTPGDHIFVPKELSSGLVFGATCGLRRSPQRQRQCRSWSA